MEQFIIFALGVASAIIVYFFKRWWEGQSLRDSLGEVTQLASLHKDLRSGAINLTQLEQLKNDLRKRKTSQQSGQDEILAGIDRAVHAEKEGSQVEYEPQTQAEMNRYSSHLAQLAEQESNFVVEEVTSHFTPSEMKAFQKAQKAWKSYADSQAYFESLEAEGGSMQSMLHSAAYRILVIERAGYIKGEVNKRNQLDF